MKLLANVLLVSCLLLTFGGCKRNKPEIPKQINKIPTLIINQADLLRTKNEQVYNSFQASGQLKPFLESLVNSEVEAVVKQIYLEEGNTVQKGQLLALLESLTLQDRLVISKQKLAKAQTNAELSRITLVRKRQAFAEDLIAKQELDQAEAAHQLNVREIISAKAQVSLDQTALGKVQIKAPINGILSQRLIKNGELARPGKAMFEILQIDPLKAELSVPSKYLNQIKLGQKVKVVIYQKAYAAKITSINPAADSVTRSLKVTALVPNPRNLLKANLFINSQIELDNPRQVILLPSEAVYPFELKSNQYWVYIYQPKTKKLFRQQIQAKILNTNQYEVLSGLEENQMILKINLDDSSVPIYEVQLQVSESGDN